MASLTTHRGGWNRHLRRGFGLGAACALGLSLTVAGAFGPEPSTAAAAGGPNAMTLKTLNARTSPADIPAGATGAMRIHRHTGSVSNGAGAVPIPGVVVAVTRVDGVDLRTSAGWELAAEYRRDLDRARAALGTSITSEPTGADGTTVVSDLPVGLYLIHELPGDGNHTPSDDILVSIPVLDPATSAWTYEVDVYPKTTSPTIAKSVADGNLGVPGQDAPVAGQGLTYTLTASIPADGLRSFGGRCVRDGAVDTGTDIDSSGFTADGTCATGATYVGRDAGAAYEISDDLTATKVPGSDPARTVSDYLEYRNDEWTGAVTVAVSGNASSTTLSACTTDPGSGCDYALTQEPGRVEISLTDAGLMKLAQGRVADPDAVVHVALQARLRTGSSGQPAPIVAATEQTREELDRATPAGVIDLPNSAVLFPSGKSKRTGSGTTSNTVVTKYSTLKLHKVDIANGAPLAGAQFTLYRTRDDAAAGANALAVTEPTDAAGMTQFPGVHVNDYQNDAPAQDSYWIVETRVPSGYMASQQPIEVRVGMDGTTVGADDTLGRPIANQRGELSGGVPPTHDPNSPGRTPDGTTPSQGSPNWPFQLPKNLPYTGAQVALMAAIAAALVGLGSYLRRRARAEQLVPVRGEDTDTDAG